MLARIRRTIGEYNFAGQYQQLPAPLGGGMVKPAWFRRYRPDELPAAFDRVVQSCGRRVDGCYGAHHPVAHD
jgi:hypothetical protein